MGGQQRLADGQVLGREGWTGRRMAGGRRVSAARRAAPGKGRSPASCQTAAALWAASALATRPSERPLERAKTERRSKSSGKWPMGDLKVRKPGRE